MKMKITEVNVLSLQTQIRPKKTIPVLPLTLQSLVFSPNATFLFPLFFGLIFSANPYDLISIYFLDQH